VCFLLNGGGIDAILTQTHEVKEGATAIPTSVLLGIALGANLHQPEKCIALALRELSGLKGVSLLGHSNVYITPPIGCPVGTPDFYNAVAVFYTTRTPLELLPYTQELERLAGRPAKGERIKNEARALDVDLLFWGNALVHSTHPNLEIPHPRMHTRCFVLEPLQQVLQAISASWVHPILHRDVTSLLAELACPTVPQVPLSPVPPHGA
jgi:2-amino-4-hydroxy-6-hydroxymethyldihydropteridine diphosphokinase